MNPRKLIRISLCLAVTLLFVAHNLGWLKISIIDKAELISYDSRLNATLPKGIDDRIVIVDIDEKSLTALGHWPWPRNILANITDSLFDHYQIAVLTFDVVFPEDDTSSGLQSLDRLASDELRDDEAFQETFAKIRPQLEYDRIFAKSLSDKNVVMGFVFDQNIATEKGALPKPMASVSERWLEKLPIREPKGYVGNIQALQTDNVAGGFFDNPIVDRDGIFRRVPMMQVYKGNVYQSLALATARAALDMPETKIVVPSAEAGASSNYTEIEFISVGKLKILVDERTVALIPFRGPYPSFQYVSAVDIKNKTINKELLENKIVLFGTTAPGLQDIRATPVQEVYPGVEIHANVIAGILDESIKHIPLYTRGYELLVLLVIGLLMTVAIPLLSPIGSTVLSATICAVLIGINMVVWQNGVVLPLASSLLLVLALFILQMSYGFFIETRSKRVLSKVFGQYIPPELVNELDLTSDIVSMDGESREMTVLFSDVRGFTTISEGLRPNELTRLMNEFLTPLTAVIHKHRGTIDKYMGDAIMAFWGAPLNDPYHQKNALLAAMEMISVLKSQEQKFATRGWPKLKIGIGLSAGMMNVGNMGSEFRMAYTVMGDTVNLGSRLESLTKQYSCDIIVNETIKTALPEFEFLELDRVIVKGKDKPVTIYEPLGYSIELDNNIRNSARNFNKALQWYRDKNWDMAEREIFALSQANPNKQVYKIYLDRIMHFRNNPPPNEWNGVFVYTSK
ncbi:MAG: adenylate/guanylate cyclase domain-containing protein [Gammaproteobacteria bacterium]|nr:adenylate/guanylate cyclase domain-containing protein [Gammaproteobacteria bacterium]